ncbi:MAG: DNA replication/repair protein RecF [Methylobacteriaceae bacterium]|nr:DNA replication/repair protein RecF [Methylobacteriaceae bacterium]
MNAEPAAVLASRPRPSRAPAVRRLILADFRSYPALDIALEARVVALTGENGAGKTNVLEALSLLSPGRGLRRAELADCARIGGRGGFAVSVEIEAERDRVQLGVGLDPPDGEIPQARRFRVDRAPVPTGRALADHLRLVWQTPAMDQLFTGSASERRRFLDRLVLAVDPDHGSRVNALERALRSRNRLLEEGSADRRWIEATEHEVAELAIAVAAARHDTVARLAALIASERRAGSPFPSAEIALDGDIEALVATMPALAAEERYREILAANRARDAAAGRTLAGPHTSDLAVRHRPKGLEARQCSTGEQKALLTGLVLAHARLVAVSSGIAPLVLLDEIAAHFDPIRRAALYDELAALGGQVWMTGADESAFAELAGRARILRVTPGRIEAAN